MIKKIFTLSLIASILLCNTLNSLEFKIKNKSKKPIFFRFFEKKNGETTPSLNNFTLLTLDGKKEKIHTFETFGYFSITWVDPASADELDVNFFKVAPGKNIDEKNIYIEIEDECILLPYSLKKDPTNNATRNDFLGGICKIQKNEKGKWKVLEEYLPKPKEKFIIQKPVIEFRPSPQPVKIIEQPLSPQPIKVIE